MLRKPHIFNSLTHIEAEFMVSKIFLIEFFLFSLERNYLYLTFKSMTSAVFYVSTVTVSILQNVLTIIWRICGKILDYEQGGGGAGTPGRLPRKGIPPICGRGLV